MIEIAALLLCKLGGQGGSSDEVKAVIEAAGLEANEEQLAKLIGDMEGKDVNELMAAGSEKIKDVPFGGGGGGGGGAGDGGGAGAIEEAKPEEKEEEEEMDLGGGMDMFGGDEGGGGGDY
ncbi:predicted protein [Phaeodactylum tricornutum CCAP 1055/1]|jgi:ribosomal protein L12E/L44/L45/RPP1/RPP2|uniref:Uncharacterized protein n=2 Tax=Phaeodactylum tricornutum TaxID=2850 RepID=B7G981_PHATC|nr:predicted protein [Phaeodactylum tricornutum CCAP 1055/1]EEC44772.1 predicted protein [Phaeodactylum tricornutum CCAP 1055/1]|eukprot:XP_002183590.1 predicted protein [Phaeodactylum tricornutum CCAP 1055/1]